MIKISQLTLLRLHVIPFLQRFHRYSGLFIHSNFNYKQVNACIKFPNEGREQGLSEKSTGCGGEEPFSFLDTFSGIQLLMDSNFETLPSASCTDAAAALVSGEKHEKLL
jgi:hypothetical protein